MSICYRGSSAGGFLVSMLLNANLLLRRESIVVLLLERKIASVSCLPSGGADILDGCTNGFGLTFDQQNRASHMMK